MEIRKAYKGSNKSDRVCYETDINAVIDESTGKKLPEIISGIGSGSSPSDGSFRGFSIDSITFNEGPKTVLSMTNTPTNQYDEKGIYYCTHLKVSDDLYLIYYEGVSEGYQRMGDRHILVMYSTDGINWSKGIPTGITSNLGKENMIIQNYAYELCAFIARGTEKPYKILCPHSDPDTNARKGIAMYESSDAINYTFKKWVLIGNHDTQVGCIDCGGNTIKVYMRTWLNGLRKIGYMYMDYDGNVIVPPSTLFGDSLYNNGACKLDDRREILFPSYYNLQNETVYPRCYIVDGYNIKEVTNVDWGYMYNSVSIKSIYVAPGFLNINGEPHLLYHAYGRTHNGVIYSDVDELRLIKVKFNVTGGGY